MQTTDSLIPLRHFPRSVVLLLVEAVRRHYMRPEEPLETRWVGLSGFWDEGQDPVFRKLSDACKPWGTFDLYVGDDGRIHGT